MRSTPERRRARFGSIPKRADDGAQQPEFYSTLTSTCTTNLVRDVNALMPGRIPLHPDVFLPGYSDRLAYKLGLIDTNLPFEQARESFHINSRAEKFANDPQFSLRIRQ